MVRIALYSSVYPPCWYGTISPELDQTFHSRFGGEEDSGEEQVYCASVPADTETGPETVTAEGGSEHNTDKKLPNDSLTYDSDYLGVVEVSKQISTSKAGHV